MAGVVGRAVHVSNLKPSVTHEQLRGVFEACGTIERVLAPGPGSYYVVYEDAGAAQRALSLHRQVTLEGRQLHVRVVPDDKEGMLLLLRAISPRTSTPTPRLLRTPRTPKPDNALNLDDDDRDHNAPLFFSTTTSPMQTMGLANPIVSTARYELLSPFAVSQVQLVHPYRQHFYPLIRYRVATVYMQQLWELLQCPHSR